MDVLGWRTEESEGREEKNEASSVPLLEPENGIVGKGVSCSFVIVAGRQKREGLERKLLNASWSSADAVCSLVGAIIGTR